MIIGWIRLAFFMLIGSSIAYLALSVYFRSVQREKLENHWRDQGLAAQSDTTREDWIAKGMQSYRRGLKRRLLWLIYILPMVAFSVIFFYSNWDGH